MTGDPFDALRVFFERGGPASWAILAVSLWLWVRIADGYAFLHLHDRRTRRARDDGARSALALASRLGPLVAEMDALVAVLPLLGLLGTVGGMIEAFDVLAYSGSTSGSADPRALSLGISRALLSTMAGLVTSLAGFFATIPLSRRVARAVRRASSDESSRDPLAVTPLLALRSRLHERAPRQEGAP